MAALAAGLGLVAAGCSAGQITQTDTQVAAVNGASGDVGFISVRDAQLLFPAEHGLYEEGEGAPMALLIANNGGEVDKLLAVTSDSSEPAEVTGDAQLEPGSSILVEADEADLGSHSGTTAPSGRTGSSSPSVTTTTPSSGSSSSSVTGTSTPTSGSSATTTTEADTASQSNNMPTTATKIPSSVDPTEPGLAKIVLKGLTKQLRPGQTILVTFLFEKAGELTLEVPIGATSEPRPAAESGGGH
ncbi:hypothetical protein [Saccharothrix xinjiangensis]|uniref:Copper(I)-binding protein n=1 Tax=Saccharothrix xinjiangensis TaxID=204798 RepID=A0ABV9XYW8_9PSEU